MLNEDYRGVSVGADAGIEFVLADRDPDGNPTSGLVRHRNSQWFKQSVHYVGSGGFWDAAWGPSRYLNIYLQKPQFDDPTKVLLGYAKYPWDASGTPTDGVVVLWNRWGDCEKYGDVGATASHEVGHYLGLHHTFYPNEQKCPPRQSPLCHVTGDLICDTNSESEAHYPCSETSSCGSTDPSSNFMAYTDGACKDSFTEEQARRMRCALWASVTRCCGRRCTRMTRLHL